MVGTVSTLPVTVDTNEFDPMPIFMDSENMKEAIEAEEAMLEPVVELCAPSTIELVIPKGEQPTKDGAVSLTVAHSAILNSIASRETSNSKLDQRVCIHTLLVFSRTKCRQATRQSIDIFWIRAEALDVQA